MRHHGGDAVTGADGLASILLRRGAPIRIPTPSWDLVPHVRGRGTADEPRRVTTAMASSRFSSHECLGDMATVKPRANRVCVLRHVCLDSPSGEFLYYRNDNATQEPVLFDQRYGHIFAFGHVAPKGGREDLLPLNKHVRYKRHMRWSPRTVSAPMPTDLPLLPKLHLLSAPFVPTNLGHLAWEEGFPLLLGMAQLGVYDEDAVILRTHGCNESIASRADPDESPQAAPSAKLCKKFVDGFLRPLGGSGKGGSGANGLLTIAHMRARHPHGVCFAQLQAGGYYDMFNAAHHAGK